MVKSDKYDKKTADKLLDFLKLGMEINESCALVGIDKNTYYNWCKKYEDFRSRAGAARANMKARHLSTNEKAAQGDDKKKMKPDWKLKSDRTGPTFEFQSGAKYMFRAGLTIAK